jgi:putative transposase
MCPSVERVGQSARSGPPLDRCHGPIRFESSCASGSSHWPKEYGRYGYRTVTDLVRRAGWDVGRAGVYSIGREEGLQVPTKQPKRARLWRAEGSCLRLRPAYRHHVWSSDFVADRTHDGRPLRRLKILAEYTRECLASVVARRIRSQDVLVLLADLCLRHGIPTPSRSDHGPECIARTLRQWLTALQVAPLSIEPGSPWERRTVTANHVTARCAISCSTGSCSTR